MKMLCGRKTSVCFMFLMPLVCNAASELTVTISKDALATLANSATVSFAAKAGHAGPLHVASSDCEFHFVVDPSDAKWNADPSAWIVEPPNVCFYDEHGATGMGYTALKQQWGTMADHLAN